MKNLSTFLQINLQHLFFEAKKRGEKIDFEKVWEYFNSRETEFIIGASIYLFKGDEGNEFDSSKFESKLATIGYTVVAKRNKRTLIRYTKSAHNKHSHNKPAYKDSNYNIEITIDCLEKLKTIDKWILMSGGEDFTALCKHLKQKNKQIEIWSFKECYNSSIESYADKIYFIDKNFFYKRPQVKVFGLNWDPK